MKKFEEAIVNELLHILLLLRVGSVIGLLALFWFTPMPWKAIVMAPFVGGPIMALSVQVWHRLQGPAADMLSPAQDAELRRVRAKMQQYRLAHLASAPTVTDGSTAPRMPVPTAVYSV